MTHTNRACLKLCKSNKTQMSSEKFWLWITLTILSTLPNNYVPKTILKLHKKHKCAQFPNLKHKITLTDQHAVKINHIICTPKMG